MMQFIQAFDTRILLDLYALRALPLTYFFIWVTEFGGFVTIFGFTAIAALVLYLQKRWHEILGLLLAVCGSAAVVFIMKEVVQRARPDQLYAAYIENFYSFPSWHATLAAALYFYLAHLVAREVPPGKWRYDTWLAAVLFIAVIGFSRLYLGVHFASDVIAGFVIGAFFAWLGIRASKILE